MPRADRVWVRSARGRAVPVDAASADERRVGEPDEETEDERINRELDQLLQELRVALPGVQVLFAFLLTVPFANGFTKVDHDGAGVYFCAVALAAVASILLIAPTVQHRLRFREGTKEQLVRTANHLAILGASALGLAIACSTYVVGDTAFPGTAARWLGPGVGMVAVLVWFVLPMAYRPGRGEGEG